MGIKRKTERMSYNELLTKLTYLTERNNLSNTEIGNIINVERRAMNGRAERNSSFKDYEIQEIEKHYNIDFSFISIVKNSFEKQKDNQIEDKAKKFGSRLLKLQEKVNLSDKDFSKLLGIYEYEYNELKSGEKEPNYRILLRIKQNFKVSIDWLLFGE